MLHKIYFLFCLFTLTLWPRASMAALPGEIEIRNETNQEIINILVEPISEKKRDFFIRLDLVPGAADKIENPGGTANLRADTGLQFWFFDNMPLDKIRRLIFCREHANCVAYMDEAGSLAHQTARTENLVPGKGAKPVCELDSFKPGMTMKEVCSILEQDIPRDDNGACLTGLGFAGMLWAARLVPSLNGPVSGESQLEHLELRKILSENDVKKILEALYKRGYTPWQAEFPGIDIDFMEIADKNDPGGKGMLLKTVDKFLEDWQAKKIAPQINNASDEEAEASIMLAPATNLQALANADNPAGDVQLFTLSLKPLSSTILLDVAAYRGNEEQSKGN